MILLTTQTGFLKPIAWLLGQIFNGLFNLIYAINSSPKVPIIGICVILFTIIVRLLLLPLTIKQQRFSKLSNVMNPELQAVQAKYKGKQDQASMLQMQAETKEIYAKYGTSPTGGCLTMLIQLPIMFALYRVIYKIPGYVVKIKYLCAATLVAASSLTGWNTDNAFTTTGNEKSGVFYNIKETESGDISDSEINKAVDSIYNLSSGKWTLVENQKITFDEEGNMKLVLTVPESADKTENTEETKVEEKTEEASEEKEVKIVGTYKVDDIVVGNKDGKSTDKWQVIGLTDGKDYYTYDISEDKWTVSTKDAFETIKANYKEAGTVSSFKQKIRGYNNFFGISLLQAPGWKLSWALIIPILAGLTQWLSAKLMENKTNIPTNEQDPKQQGMQSSMKMMNTIMPIMSAVFCVNFVSCIGLYWIISSVVQCIIQIFINKKMDNIEVEDLVKINLEKANEKRARKGLAPLKMSSATTDYVSQVKKMEAREARKAERDKEIEDSTSYYKTAAKPGSLAAKANMVKMFNEKNNKKED